MQDSVEAEGVTIPFFTADLQETCRREEENADRGDEDREEELQNSMLEEGNIDFTCGVPVIRSDSDKGGTCIVIGYF